MSNCCIVLGRPRSGTSMLARIVHDLGYKMGQTLVSADNNNKYGYYEDLEFNNIHQKMINNDWDVRLNFYSHSVAYQQLIKARSQNQYWGVKDPKMCYVLSEFVKYAGDLKLKLIHIDRCIEDSILSTFKFVDSRHSITECEAWQKKYEKAKLNVLSQYQGEILHLNYNTIKFDFIDRIAKFLNVENKLRFSSYVKTEPIKLI